MTHHIVLWKAKSGLDKHKAGQRIKALIEGLVGIVPGLIDLDVGSDVIGKSASWDFALHSRHESPEALENYRVHPEHVAVAKIVGEMVSDRAVVDWHD